MKTQMKTVEMIKWALVVLVPAAALMVLLPISATQALGQDYTAVVASVDYPEGCLRIRSGPSSAAPIIGCADLGTRVRLTGIYSGNWAEISLPMVGWVYGPQLDVESGPPVVAGPVDIPPPVVDYIPFPWLRYPYRVHRHWVTPRRHRVYRHAIRKHGHPGHVYRNFHRPPSSHRIRRGRTIQGPRVFQAHNRGFSRLNSAVRANVGAFRSRGAGHRGFGGHGHHGHHGGRRR